MKTSRVLIQFLLLGALTALVDRTFGAGGTNVVRLTPTYINEMGEWMRTNHPALRALQARARASGHSADGVRAWDDPRFRFGGVVASGKGPSLEEDGDLVYALEQKLPLFGQPSAQRRVARKETEAAQARQEMQFQFYRRDLAKRLFAVALAEDSVDIGRRDLTWLETMVAASEARYRAGAATQTELLRLQNERARRANALVTETQVLDQAWVSVRRLASPPAVESRPRLQLPEIWPELKFDSRLLIYAVKFEPTLRLMAREIDAAEAQVAATRKGQLPEVFAGIEGRQYSGDGNFREGQFTVGLSLPWLNRGRYQSDVARDRARLEAAQLDRASEELRVREEVQRLFTEIDAARREALLYRDEILPRSRQAMDVAHADWSAGRGMFLETMEARRMLLEAELQLARAIARQFEGLSELVLCCGLGDLEALETFLERQR